MPSYAFHVQLQRVNNLARCAAPELLTKLIAGACACRLRMEPVASRRPSARVLGPAMAAGRVPRSAGAFSPRSGPSALSPLRTDSPPSSELSVDSISSTTSDETANLSCPICNESMVTLLQLNRHLDDVHSEVEKVENEQLRSWFRKKVEKARQLQNVTSVFNTGLGKLDLFEQDDSQGGSPVVNGTTSGDSTPKRLEPPPTDSVVTRAHWQEPTGHDKCSDVVCDKTLNGRNGSVNCRQCGKLFCNGHTMYQMKLSLKANHDPEGIWCRVCETCFKSREGYNDRSGTMHDVSNEFIACRQRRINVRELEVNKLEKRLVKLINALAELSGDSGIFNYASAGRRKQIEHQITVWQDDKLAPQCPICQQKFGYALRKHHCRVCGKVICADLGTDCSRDVQVGILSNKLDGGSGQLPRRDDISIRICRDCRDTIFAKKNFERDLGSARPQILKYYDSMARVKHSIEMLMPRFQGMLLVLDDPESPPSHETLNEAAVVRKRLLDSFMQYDTMARKVLTCQVLTDSEKRLQKQIYLLSAQFLQDHMLPLKALPKALRHANGDAKSSGVPTSSPTTNLSEQEIQNYREQLIVLEEQKFMVTGMISQSKSRRKFDEVVPLEQSLDDLNQEIDKVRTMLGEFAID
jgi:rabenosyn-5